MTVRIAHLADLHFGEEIPGLAASLAEDIRAHSPDAIAVSGDLTRSARPAELAAALAFLSGLAAPVLAVPGNHDIPTADLWARLHHPRRIWQHAAPPGAPLMVGKAALIGLDTVSRGQWHLDWSAGAITAARRTQLAAALAAAPRGALVVAHHPLRHPPGSARRYQPRGASATLAILREAGARAVLSGHLHRAAALPLGTPWPLQIVTPSALSPRGDGMPNGWLLLEQGPGFIVRLRQFVGGIWQERELINLP